MIVVGVALILLTVAAVLDHWWPWDWKGRRRNVRIKTGRKDWGDED